MSWNAGYLMARLEGCRATSPASEESPRAGSLESDVLMALPVGGWSPHSV